MEYFKKALNNFTADMAYGAAVRKLFDGGMPISEIQKNVDFPITEAQLLSCIWEHLLASRAVLLAPPEAGDSVRYDYVKETDALGRSCFRRITVENTAGSPDYFPVTFGKQKVKNSPEFQKAAACLSADDRLYLLGLPWPPETVYHVKNERLLRLLEIL